MPISTHFNPIPLENILAVTTPTEESKKYLIKIECEYFSRPMYLNIHMVWIFDRDNARRFDQESANKMYYKQLSMLGSSAVDLYKISIEEEQS